MADGISMAGKDSYITPSTLTTKSAIVGKGAEDLSMNDFFSLLVAQMTNQDMFNPTSDTEYVSQMAMFTVLSGIQTIQEYQLSSYAASYVGKTVAIAHTSDSGNLTRTEGVVTGVTFYDGDPKVVVDGISYPLYSVMEVKTAGSSDTALQSQASGYIGKLVTVTYVDEDEDEEVEVTGTVTSVNIKDGKIYVILDNDKDEEYLASLITSMRDETGKV